MHDPLFTVLFAPGSSLRNGAHERNMHRAEYWPIIITGFRGKGNTLYPSLYDYIMFYGVIIPLCWVWWNFGDIVTSSGFYN